MNDKEFKERLYKIRNSRHEYLHNVASKLKDLEYIINVKELDKIEAAEIIRKAKGKVVLAHPIAYVHEDNLTDLDILEIVKDMNPDGIEAYYLYVDRY